jgi:hypothetical protein
MLNTYQHITLVKYDKAREYCKVRLHLFIFLKRMLDNIIHKFNLFFEIGMLLVTPLDGLYCNWVLLKKIDKLFFLFFLCFVWQSCAD